MAIDFPNSPANNDSFSSGNKTWEYDGTAWVIKASSAAIATGSITDDKLASNAVTTVKIADGAITAAKIADGTIVAAEIAANAVTTAKILDANVTAAKIASDAVTTVKILDANVTTAKILDANVTAAKIASDAVTTVKILDANVTADKIASDAVTTAKILDANVTAAKIASDAITQAKIADRAVGSAELTGLTLNAQTGTTYTLVLTDAHDLITLNNASAITLTIPTNASVAFTIGDQVNFLQLGAGQVTVGGAGVTIRSEGSKLKLKGQYAAATCIKIGTDEWVLVGNLSA